MATSIIGQGDRCTALEHCILKCTGEQASLPWWSYDWCATKAPQNNPDPLHHHTAATGSTSYCRNTNEDATTAEEHNADPRNETSSPQEELQRPIVNNILAGIREQMNLETSKRKTRAEKQNKLVKEKLKMEKEKSNILFIVLSILVGA